MRSIRPKLAFAALLAVLVAVVVLPCACGKKGSASSQMSAEEMRTKMQASQDKAYGTKKGG
jgi:hypothetical protein